MTFRYEARPVASSHGSPRAQRLRQRAVVEIIELTADRKPVRELRQAHRIGFEPVGDVMRRRLPLKRGIHGEHHFIHPAFGYAGNQTVDCQILRTHPVECRQTPTQHVEPPRKQTRALECPQVGNFLDHSDRPVVAARIGADAAGIGCVDVPARGAFGEPLVDAFERTEQWHQRAFAFFEQMQHRASRRPRAQAGQPGECLRQSFDFGGRHDVVLRLDAAKQKPFGEAMRIIFMGTPDFAVPSLNALFAAGHDVLAVYTQPPRRAGRGKALMTSPVHRRVEVLGIEVRHPVSLRDGAAQAEFAAFDADVAVVAAYGLILPQAILDVPRHGCINVHASLLPRWRGAAPIHRAILAGDKQTGVTIMQMEAGLDTGPMLATIQTEIGAKTCGELTADLAEIGAARLVEVLADLQAFPAVVQPEEGTLYAPKIDKSESHLDFLTSATQVERQVRAFAPTPGAFFQFAGERFRILKAEALITAQTARPGTIIDDALTIACNPGAIRPTLVQRAGRGVMTPGELLRGFTIPNGSHLR